MKKYLFIFIFSNFVTIHTFAQNVLIEEDSSVTRLMTNYVRINKATETIAGWTVMLLVINDRRKVEEAKKVLHSKYPDVAIDWTHEKPYYKLKAGAFRSKTETLKLLYTLKSDYPTAYPARDKVKVKDMVGF